MDARDPETFVDSLVTVDGADLSVSAVVRKSACEVCVPEALWAGDDATLEAASLSDEYLEDTIEIHRPETKISISLERWYSFHAVIKDPSGSPVVGASVKLQTEDQVLREETSNSDGAVEFVSFEIPQLEDLVIAGARLQLSIHDRQQELRTTTVGVEFPKRGEPPKNTSNVRYVNSTLFSVEAEV